MAESITKSTTLFSDPAAVPSLLRLAHRIHQLEDSRESFEQQEDAVELSEEWLRKSQIEHISTVIRGVKVESGDIVVGDSDGVVILKTIVTDVYIQAQERVRSEDKVRDEIEDGISPFEV